MDERYTKLFALPENLYCAGAPVIISAGAIQKDNQTGKVFTQLKLRNIRDKVIKALTVQLAPFDTAGKPLGQKVSHQYLDLSAGRDTDFGQKALISLPDPSTRSFSASVAEVIFADNSVWTASGGSWEPLSPLQTPEGAFEDGQLAQQFRLEYGGDCRCMFHREKDLWRCVCGAVNHEGEAQCHRCQREAAALAALDVSQLEKARDARLAEEQKKAAAEKAAAELRAKKNKKIALIAAPIVVVAIIAAVLFSNWTKARQAEAARLEDYNAAVALVEAGQYDEAIDAFGELGDYQDSKEWANQKVAYEKALYLLDCAKRGDEAGLNISTQTKPKDPSGSAEPSAMPAAHDASYIPPSVSARCYQKAITILEELGDYQDSAERLAEAEAALQEAEAALQVQETEALLPRMVKEFGDKANGGEESQEYFQDNKDLFTQLDEQEITEAMADHWVVKETSNRSDLYYQVILYKDGTGAFLSEMDGSTPSWSADGTEFHFHATFQLVNRTYELYKLDDGLYMAYDSLGAPSILFAAASSTWGQQIKEDGHEILSISYS